MLALIIILLAAGVLLMLLTYFNRKKKNVAPEIKVSVNEECCGAHEVCDRDTLLNSKAELVYYDDEELDQLSGIKAANYSASQIQQLTEVFETLPESDVAGWLRSLQMRCIDLPAEIKEQALLIVSERRTTHSS